MGGLASSRPVKPFNAVLGALRAAISDMQAMILAARRDLRGWTAASAALAVDSHGATDAGSAVGLGAGAPMQLGQAAAPVKTETGAVPTIANRATAAAALDAAKAWLAAHEPSSPAFVLVTQARLLAGAPLVEANEVLLPGQSGNVMLNIGRGSGFSMPMAR